MGKEPVRYIWQSDQPIVMKGPDGKEYVVQTGTVVDSSRIPKNKITYVNTLDGEFVDANSSAPIKKS